MKLIHKKKSEGQEVKRLQKALGGIATDGKFGPNTKKALKYYQKHNGLTPDGISGPATRASLGIEINLGVDVSDWNGNVRWSKVDSNEVKYCWVKMSEGQTFKAKTRKHNLTGCRENNILVGGYHFSRPESGGSDDPKKEVQNFLKAYGEIPKGDLLPVLDLEHGKKGDPEHNRQWALEWLSELENETGLRGIVYTARWYVGSYLKRNIGELKEYPLWVADYTKTRIEPDSLCGWDEWSVWQWSGGWEIDGFTETGVRKVDANWLPGGCAALEQLKVK